GAGDSDSVITGGGDDLTKAAGQIKRGEIQAKKHRRDEVQRQERIRMLELKRHLDQAIVSSDKMMQFKDQIRVEITPDGLRIQIVDDFKRPMFDTGSARVKDYMRDILREFGRVLNEVDSKLVLTGHTDSAQYAAGDKAYSNWELSADRANASRRELIAGGMEPAKIVRVVGLADSSPLDKENPMNPLNRRISIIVLNKLAEERMQMAGGEIEAGDSDSLEKSVVGETAAPGGLPIDNIAKPPNPPNANEATAVSGRGAAPGPSP
ncbi:MAG TPA: OmpA family protein, partial [Burkholderiaceae bacterium]|nr:OmpA family protein [Burkholderiaceae bacterium]